MAAVIPTATTTNPKRRLAKSLERFPGTVHPDFDADGLALPSSPRCIRWAFFLLRRCLSDFCRARVLGRTPCHPPGRIRYPEIHSPGALELGISRGARSQPGALPGNTE